MKIKKENLTAVIILLLTVTLLSLINNINSSYGENETEKYNEAQRDKEQEENFLAHRLNFYSDAKEGDVNHNVTEDYQGESKSEDEKVLKGAWVSYISLASKSEKEFSKNFIMLADKAKDKGITDLFVHIRPFMDSVFISEYFPVSHLITGVQGEEISFDALEFMIEETHKRGMRFHGWINPLRISLKETPKELSEKNIYNKYKESDPYFFIETDTVTVLNPAYSFTRELVSNGIREIVDKYEVDGIHFDDYFYPEDYDVNSDPAYKIYRESTENPLEAKDWMFSNINSLVALCFQAAKSSEREVSFGISPQGNIDNNALLGADVKTWCETYGYIDYVCPQLYWSYENPSLGFDEALNNWMELSFHKDLKIYIGLALYKVNTESDRNTWDKGVEIIYKQQIDTLSKGADGYVLYEISHFDKLI